MILNELEDLPGFIIEGHNLNNATWHFADMKIRKKTDRTLRQDIKIKQEERSNP